MYNKVLSCATCGIDGILINVEADVSDGLPTFAMVGFLASEVKEANERVRTAMRNTGFIIPPKKITVNLSPADIRKEGSAFDLPIAISILAAMGYIPDNNLTSTLIVGELSLNGLVNHINGVLPMVHYAKMHGIERCIVPFDNRFEGAVIEGIKVIGVKNLKETVEYLNDIACLTPESLALNNVFDVVDSSFSVDFSMISGQETMRRAVEVAVSGRHNIIISGSAGSGKSLIAKCIPTIMPKLNFEESIDITKLYSISGMLKEGEGLVTKRPFRSPHHTISPKALIGGGNVPKPGEISLAHNGVLFLDELPEFNKNVIEMLRQPLEDKVVHISRVHGSYTFPADTMLVAALNPCPCGNYPDMTRCTCTDYQIKRYINKISRPVLDRIDIAVDVFPVKYDELYGNRYNEDSKTIRGRIIKAQKIQQSRYKYEGISYNSQLDNRGINKYCSISSEDGMILKTAFENMKLSARGGQRILKVARTIADMDGENDILTRHLTEAIAYRMN